MKVLGILTVTMLLLITSVSASALRCGNKIVELGYTEYKVQSYCGEPDFVKTYTEYNYAYDMYGEFGEASSVIDQWTYNFGSQSFLYVLIFRDGRLERIETDGYGF